MTILPILPLALLPDWPLLSFPDGQLHLYCHCTFLSPSASGILLEYVSCLTWGHYIPLKHSNTITHWWCIIPQKNKILTTEGIEQMWHLACIALNKHDGCMPVYHWTNMVAVQMYYGCWLVHHFHVMLSLNAKHMLTTQQITIACITWRQCLHTTLSTTSTEDATT